jgi:D-glycero-D-manno-heptose 1,7-bisphosphate phosphatase
MDRATILRGFELCIFDADDTLRRTTVPGRPCPRAPGEWQLLPGVRETLHAIAWNRPGQPRLGVASNQDQVGAGLVTAAMARQLLTTMTQEAAGFTPPPSAIQLCPHAVEVACDCRKPRPGMLRRIMAWYGVAPSGTVFIGDSAADRGAAAAAGVAFLPPAEVFGWDQSA